MEHHDVEREVHLLDIGLRTPHGSDFHIYSFIAGEKIQMLQTPVQWAYAAQLALLPTVLSLFFMTISINLIGSTPAAIMGALEPVTAVIIGVFVFGESFTFQLAIGIAAILAGVTLIIARKKG